MRRTVVVVLVLTGVAAGGFGLGYLLGHKGASPGPSAVQTPTPRAVLVPKLLHLSMSDAVQTLMKADLAFGQVKIRTGGEPGTIVAQFPPSGTSAPPGSPVNLFVSKSVYSRGAFEWCPDVRGTLPVGVGLRQEAEQVALRFSQGFLMATGEQFAVSLTPRPCPFRRISGRSPESRGVSGLAPSGCTGGPLSHTDAARTWRPAPLSSWSTTEQRAPAQTSTFTWSAGPTA